MTSRLSPGSRAPETSAPTELKSAPLIRGEASGFCERGVCFSVVLDARRLRDGGPFLDIARHLAPKLLGRAPSRIDAHGGEALLSLGQLHGASHFALQPRHDGGRRLRRREKRCPYRHR